MLPILTSEDGDCMRFVSYKSGGRFGIAAQLRGQWHGLVKGSSDYPGTLLSLIQAGGEALSKAEAALSNAPAISLEAVEMLPPIANPEKIVCVGLNYKD